MNNKSDFLSNEDYEKIVSLVDSTYVDNSEELISKYQTIYRLVDDFFDDATFEWHGETNSDNEAEANTILMYTVLTRLLDRKLIIRFPDNSSENASAVQLRKAHLKKLTYLKELVDDSLDELNGEESSEGVESGKTGYVWAHLNSKDELAEGEHKQNEN